MRSIATLLAMTLAASAHAGLPPVFQRYLKMFDGDYQRLAPEFSNAGVDQATKDGYFKRMENHLAKVPKNFHAEPDVKERLDKLAALKSGGGAPAAAPAAGMSDPDRARQFNADHQALSNAMRATRSQAEWSDPARVADFQKRLAALKALQDGFQDPSLGYVQQCQKNYQALADHLARATASAAAASAPKPPEPAPASSGGAVATPAAADAPLDFQSNRMIGFFDKDHGRYQAMFDEPLVAKRLAEYQAAIAKLENWISKIPPAGLAHPEGQKRQALVAAMKAKLAAQLGDAKVLPDGDRQLLAQFQSLYQRNSFKIDGAAANPMSLQDPAERARVEELLKTVRAPLEQVSMKDHPDVVKALAKLGPLDEAMRAGVAQASAMAEEAGDIDAQVARMQETFPYQKFDPSFPGGDAAAVEAWAERLKAWETGAKEGYAWLEKVSKLTLKAKEQAFKDYKSWFRAGPERALKNAKDEVVDGWFSKSRAALMNVNPNIANLSKDAALATAARLEASVPDLERLIAFQRVYEGKVDEEFAGGKKKLEDVVAKLRGDVATRAARQRMPAAEVSQDAQYLAIAKEVLADPKYGAGEVRRLLVRSHPKKEVRVEYFDGKWWTKDYDEFMVSFAGKKDGKWFVKHAKLRFLRSAWAATCRPAAGSSPICGARTRSSRRTSGGSGLPGPRPSRWRPRPAGSRAGAAAGEARGAGWGRSPTLENRRRAA